MKIIKGHIVSAKEFGKLEILENGYLVLDENGVIVSVSEKLPEKYQEADRIDYGDRLILHSFVDMHLHAPQYPMLGMGMDLPLLDWLKTYTFRVEAQFQDTGYAREVYHSLAKDLIGWGVTRVVMFSSLHTEATWILMEELEKAGVTGYVGKVNMDRNGGENLQETTEESKAETLRWLEGCKRFRYVKPILTPRFTPSCTDELMAWLGELAKERGLYVQSHMNENLDEIQWVKELVPDCDQYWQTYAKNGMWKDHTVMAHCVHIDENEITALRDSHVVVAHCADSNINLCSGIAPVKRLVKEGVWVTLGSDISAGAQLSMANVITMTIRSSKVKAVQEGNPSDFLTVEEGYYLGTVSGHKYFGAGEGFCVGDTFHAIVVDDSDWISLNRPLSVRERFERAMYRLEKENIVAVYSEGRRVLERTEQIFPNQADKETMGEEETVIAYVDGSFEQNLKKYAYGCVILYKGEKITLSGAGSEEMYLSMRNVSGEILGSMNAINWAIAHGAKKIHIYYDYEGIAKWAEGNWKTNKEGTKKYKQFIEESRKKIKISFTKVVAHTGVELNEQADKLAKAALGIV